MRARLVVFPVKGRNWCFSKSIEPSASQSESSRPAPKLKDLWKKISTTDKPMYQNAELVVDFFSNKHLQMNRAWVGFEKAPGGSFKNKIHVFGMKLMARVKPSENFLKSISKEDTAVDITYPMSLNPRLVRRRLRHIALRGTIIHRRYFYGSVSLLPFTAAFAILPLPNFPFFWMLFRSYSHWRALKGSERLLLLVSDHYKTSNPAVGSGNRTESDSDESKQKVLKPGPLWILHPSEDLDKYLRGLDEVDGLSKSVISDICKAYHLDTNEVVKYLSAM